MQDVKSAALVPPFPLSDKAPPLGSNASSDIIIMRRLLSGLCVNGTDHV